MASVVVSAAEVAALTERLVALDVAVGARGAVGAALASVRTAAAAVRGSAPGGGHGPAPGTGGREGPREGRWEDPREGPREGRREDQREDQREGPREDRRAGGGPEGGANEETYEGADEGAYEGADQRADKGAGEGTGEGAGEAADRRLACAELFQVAAWITFDAERHAISQRLSRRALALARGGGGAGRAAVEALVLAVLAMQEEHLGRPADSLRIASAFLARAEPPGLVTAIFHVRAGRALARLGHRERTLRELRTAAELLADGPTGRDPAWAWWFDQQELDGHHGLARAALGDLDTAAELLHGAARPEDDGPAYRVLFTAELARVLARAGDWHGADAVMAPLLEAVPSVGSVRALRAMGHAARIVTHGRRVPRRPRATARELALLTRHVLGVSGPPVG